MNERTDETNKAQSNFRLSHEQDISDFLLNYCTNDFGRILGVASALNVRTPGDFRNYSFEELREKGLTRKVIQSLEIALWNMASVSLRKADRTPKGYVPERRGTYRLTEYDVRKDESGGKVIVNGIEVSVPKTGAKRLKLDDLFQIYYSFREGKSTVEVAKEIGKTDACVRRHLTDAFILVSEEELART